MSTSPSTDRRPSTPEADLHPVPLLDLKPQLTALEAEMKEAVLSVLDSTRYILGPKVEQFESEMAEYCGTQYAVGVSSGTDALLACMMALDIGPGDLVLVPDFSFFATAGVVSRVGAKPIFLDIDPVTFNLDPNAVERWLADHPAEAARVKAIVPVHLYGQCAAMDPLMRIGRDHGIPLIEDAAQAIGATYPSECGTFKAGSMGLAGCFSFFPSKNLGAIGDAGMVTTNDANFADKIRKLRMHGETTRYHHAYVGGNFRMAPIQAAALSVKLPHLEDWHAARRENAAFYDEAFADLEGIQTPQCVYGREHHIYNQYTVRISKRATASGQQNRDTFKAHLDAHKIGNAVYYPVPFHQQECFSNLSDLFTTCPSSDGAAGEVISIPVFPDLKKEMRATTIERIGGFFHCS